MLGGADGRVGAVDLGGGRVRGTATAVVTGAEREDVVAVVGFTGRVLGDGRVVGDGVVRAGVVTAGMVSSGVLIAGTDRLGTAILGSRRAGCRRSELHPAIDVQPESSSSPNHINHRQRR